MKLKQKLYNIVLLLMAIAAMVSCAAPTKTVVMPTTERVINNDSTIILVKDSIVERVKNDTVHKHHYHYYYDRRAKTDTITKEIPVRVEVPKEITPEWAIWSLLGNIAIAVLIILYVVIKITKTVYLRR